MSRGKVCGAPIAVLIVKLQVSLLVSPIACFWCCLANWGGREEDAFHLGLVFVPSNVHFEAKLCEVEIN